MSAVVAVNGAAASRALLSVPAWGLWWLDVDLVEPLALPVGTVVSATVGGQALSGAVASGAAYEGRASYRIVAGRGKWGSTVGRRGYRNDAGVRAADVVRDAAEACGEVVDTTALSGVRLGPHYARAEGPAVHALGLLAPRRYWTDYAGTMRFDARSTTTVSGALPRTAVRPAPGVVELAIESLDGLAPGVIASPATEPATDLEVTLEGGRLTARLYAGRATSRRLQAWARLLDALDPGRRYRASYEYRVVTQTGERYNLQPARVASGMPDLLGVPVRGAPGVRGLVTPGSLVVVTFLDADPSRPVVVAHEAADAPGWMPLAVRLGADPVLGVARMTDPVIAGPFAGTIVSGSARILAGL